ncbi:MAG: beta-propeller fold lactonase family protein [Solirubrobacterales bacterium]
MLLGVVSAASVLAFAASAQAAPYAYVANADGDGPSDVSQFNVGAGGLLSALSPPTVAAGSGPTGVAVSPDGRSVYVTNLGDNTLSQYDVGAGGGLSPKSPAAVGAADGPEGIAVNPNGKNVYVAASFSDRILHENITVYDVNPATGALSGRGNVRSHGDTPHSVAVSPDGNSLYATQCCTDNGVAQFDITANGGLVPKTPSTVHIFGTGAGVAVNPDGKSVYVTSYVGSTIYQFNVGAGGKLSPKSPASVQTAECCVYGVVASPDGKSVYVVNSGHFVYQFNVGAGGKLSPKSPAKVASGGGSQGIAVTPDGKSLYVATLGVDQFDIGAGGKLAPKTPATVAAGSGPLGIAVNPLGGPASVSISGNTLVVTGGVGNKDNFAITRPLPGTLRVTNLVAGPYTGSAVSAGAGCAQVNGQTAKCNASGINMIRVSAHDQADKVVNSTGLKSALFGEKGADTLVGGLSADTLTGGPDADVMKGMNGSDQLLARDMTSDTTINCDGGNAPGSADKADLDQLPKDPNSVVQGCETKTRH